MYFFNRGFFSPYLLLLLTLLALSLIPFSTIPLHSDSNELLNGDELWEFKRRGLFHCLEIYLDNILLHLHIVVGFLEFFLHGY